MFIVHMGLILFYLNLSRSTLFFILFPNKFISLLLFPLSNSNIEQYCQESVKKAAKKSEPGVQYISCILGKVCQFQSHKFPRENYFVGNY